jgi:PAS domain-containing protein
METRVLAPRLITIPTSDRAFHEHVRLVRRTASPATPEELERRLRLIFPRAVVRDRNLSGEHPAWYVYRDGQWRPAARGDWWTQPGVPRVTVSREGWLTSANATAAGLLAISPDDVRSRHFTDFVVPGTLEDSMALFRIIDQGSDLDATVLLRPTTGEVIAVDLHASRRGEEIVGVFRLSDDIAVTNAPPRIEDRHQLTFIPATDVAFRAYALLAYDRMPEPTPDGLALRLRRLYPHASVDATEDRWTISRDRQAELAQSTWWTDSSLPRVRYDAQALILETNAAAEALFGRKLVGHHWQEFVTPGSTEQVSVMLEILSEVGAAESRFRMPRADGSLLEFDSYTEVTGENFDTVFRPIAAT